LDGQGVGCVPLLLLSLGHGLLRWLPLSHVCGRTIRFRLVTGQAGGRPQHAAGSHSLRRHSVVVRRLPLLFILFFICNPWCILLRLTRSATPCCVVQDGARGVDASAVRRESCTTNHSHCAWAQSRLTNINCVIQLIGHCLGRVQFWAVAMVLPNSPLFRHRVVGIQSERS
jgi:hypothetical protein